MKHLRYFTQTLDFIANWKKGWCRSKMKDAKRSSWNLPALEQSRASSVCDQQPWKVEDALGEKTSGLCKRGAVPRDCTRSRAGAPLMLSAIDREAVSNKVWCVSERPWRHARPRAWDSYRRMPQAPLRGVVEVGIGRISFEEFMVPGIIDSTINKMLGLNKDEKLYWKKSKRWMERERKLVYRGLKGRKIFAKLEIGVRRASNGSRRA